MKAGRTGSLLWSWVQPEEWIFKGLLLTLLLGVCWSPGALSLEVSVGKIPSLEALNGSDVLLPCSFTSCIGYEDLLFRWSYNRNGTLELMLEATIKGPKYEPRILFSDYRVQFAGTSKTNNISIILLNVDFEDSGQYICYAKNPKEKNRVHRATYTLLVVSEMKVVDKTLTTIIASVVGGLIGFLIVFLLGKKLILFAIAKSRERKECLVSSSGIDNTENGPTGTKGNKKPTPKA
ncbi:sodium channel subunit beta-4-like isoform X1 [Acipenser ruthenus]|uniref:sodium channel subunit beta-4 isoform X1 n=1 Tax=Acipenser ruthenus TaxID=7906 RepID=UPI0015604414|nr:sodium channel subunit beta-4 isoform X1 [Acipenser ruthenus]XP_058865568.1 sodium channel subunit beta-4-like isoform X1 [Acipenser ruthenus]